MKQHNNVEIKHESMSEEQIAMVKRGGLRLSRADNIWGKYERERIQRRQIFDWCINEKLTCWICTSSHKHIMETRDGETIITGDPKMSKIISREEVNLELMQELLETCYYARMDKEDDEIFLEDLRVRIYVYVFEELSLIRLHAQISPNKTVSPEKMMPFLNNCNNDFIVGKFLVEEHYKENSEIFGNINFEYDIDYYYGVTPASIIRAIKQFEDTAAAMVEHGKDLGVL